jgi:hypothetical protein
MADEHGGRERLPVAPRRGCGVVFDCDPTAHAMGYTLPPLTGAKNAISTLDVCRNVSGNKDNLLASISFAHPSRAATNQWMGNKQFIKEFDTSHVIS